MHKLLPLILIIAVNTGLSQNTYEAQMKKAYAFYQEASSTEQYLESAANFERISLVEQNEWLPQYYHAQSYILLSFNDSKADESQKDAYLDIAEKSLENLIARAPGESEVYALQALYYTGRLVVNPMARASKFSPLTSQAIEKSLAISPNNPRALQLQLSNKVGTAQFFGQDISAFCIEAQTLLDNWDNYKIRGEYYPTWGKGQVLEILKECKTTPPDNSDKPKTTKHTLTVEIVKLKSDKGNVMLELIDEKENTIARSIGTVKEGTSTLTLENLDPGTYAVRFFHDENENQRMDSGKYGKPTESYGFSNNARGFFGPPKLKKMLFDLNSNTSIKIKGK